MRRPPVAAHAARAHAAAHPSFLRAASVMVPAPPSAAAFLSPPRLRSHASSPLRSLVDGGVSRLNVLWDVQSTPPPPMRHLDRAVLSEHASSAQVTTTTHHCAADTAEI